jgi:hypothetical protein
LTLNVKESHQSQLITVQVRQTQLITIKNQNEDYKFHHNLISSTYGLHFIKVVLCILLELSLLDFTITLYVYVSLGSCCVVLKTLEENLFFSIGGKKNVGSD